ncbi:MAG: hypothetical protein AAF654_03675 [Myxococcota bacterium]
MHVSNQPGASAHTESVQTASTGWKLLDDCMARGNTHTQCLDFLVGQAPPTAPQGNVRVATASALALPVDRA